jgi:2-polyprenyl-6-methoxyphenol hydroxylase-like FAD-dependent oxidoreductase
VTDVLVVGAGPVGLTAAAELRRHGVACRVVDRLEMPPQYAKAVGIQPHMLEVWEDMGVVRAMLDAAVGFEGQIVFVNGGEAARMRLELPHDVPYGFVGLPQYETERLLALHLEALGGTVERGVELRSLEQDEGVTVVLAGREGEEQLRCRYVVGCDGARERARGSLRTYSVLADGVDTACVQLPWVYDRDRAFRAAYGTRGTCAYLVRPDGYVGYRGGSPSREGIEAAPARVLR